MNTGEAREVEGIEGKDAVYAVNEHGGGETGVVDLDAGDGVGDEESAPQDVNFGCVGEHWNLAFDNLRSTIRFPWR